MASALSATSSPATGATTVIPTTSSRYLDRVNLVRGAATIFTNPSVAPAQRARSTADIGWNATCARPPYRSYACASVSPTRPTSGSVNVVHGSTRAS